VEFEQCLFNEDFFFSKQTERERKREDGDHDGFNSFLVSVVSHGKSSVWFHAYIFSYLTICLPLEQKVPQWVRSTTNKVGRKTMQYKS